MSERKLPFDVLDGAAHRFQQDQQVVGKVGGLVDEAVAVAVHGLDDHFRGLFAHFLGDGLGCFIASFKHYVQFASTESYLDLWVMAFDEN